MRSDLPGARDRADELPAWPRERLTELRDRLERLPPGHPSSAGYPLQPGGFGAEDEADDGAGTEADDGAGPDAGAGPDPGTEPDPETGHETGPGAGIEAQAEAPGAQPDSGREPDGHADSRAAAGRRGPGHQAAATAGRYAGPWGSLQPYQPWFSDACWASPWFTGEMP